MIMPKIAFSSEAGLSSCMRMMRNFHRHMSKRKVRIVCFYYFTCVFQPLYVSNYVLSFRSWQRN